MISYLDHWTPPLQTPPCTAEQEAQCGPMNLLPRSLASWTVELERQFGSLSSDTLSLDRPEFELELESRLGSEFDVEFEFELGCEFEFELEFDRRAYGGRKKLGDAVSSRFP